MASTGNPNQSGGFDVQKLFKPGPVNPNPNQPPGYGASPSSPFPPSYSPSQLQNLSNLQGGPFSFPSQNTPYHHYMRYPQDPLPNSNPPRPIAYPSPSPPPYTSAPMPPPHPGFSQQSTASAPSQVRPSPVASPNPGARLMALLSTHSSGEPLGPTNLELPLSAMSSLPESYPYGSPHVISTLSSPTMAPAIPTAPPASSGTPSRLPSSKLSKGRHLSGDHVVYDVDVRLPGEVQPQLEVAPITKYVSDPNLVFGRQIAVNRTYICYGLKLGAIRVLNIHTALRSLLQRQDTQSQNQSPKRVTDMAFFAEDVHLLASASIDGRVFIWKINEGPDAEDKPQITGKVILAIQIVGDAEQFHPRICWHSHKQEVLYVGIGKRVLRIDTTQVGKGEAFSVEEPIKCPVEKLIDGVTFIGKHDGEVTDLSMCQWMTSRLASASSDGTIKIWEDRKLIPLATLRPHDGQPVNSATFLTAPHRPDHIILLTGGPLNREIKVWTSAGQEGWLLPSDAESWQCTQTLDLRSSTELQVEDAFFNQVVVLRHADLILLANAKKNAIYAVHVEYGPSPSATRMDYLAEFTVTMPILSLTGISGCSPDGEHAVQVYCVQTQAIQQYSLNLSLCLPQPLEHVCLDKDSGMSRVFEVMSSDGFTDPPLPASKSDVSSVHELPISSIESKLSGLPPEATDAYNVRVASPPLPTSPRLLGRMDGSRSPSKSFEQGSSVGGDTPVVDCSVERRVVNLPNMDESSGKEEIKFGQNDISVLPNPSITFRLGNNPTHLITPSEILSMSATSAENAYAVKESKAEETKVQDVIVSKDEESVEVEVKVVGESGSNQNEFEPQKESRILVPEMKEKSFCSQASDIRFEMTRECCSLPTELFSSEGTRQVEGVGVAGGLEQSSNAREEELVQDSVRDMPSKVPETAPVLQSPSSASKGKKNKAKSSQTSISSTPSPFNSTDSSSGEPSSLSVPSTEAAASQILAMQEALNQLITMQKDMQKQLSVMVAVPVSKEARKLETTLGRNIEKVVKANVDALWARFQEENAKQEKLDYERVQQLTSLISSFMNKDLPTTLERVLKKEIAAVGPSVARTITPILEKTIPSAIADSFQRGVGDKAMNQLDKTVSSKLESAVSRQIQAQFQTSGKQALQDALRSSLESSIIPAFELSCKAMFEQVDATFQKGIVEHTAAAQQQFGSTHSALALALREAINSASSISQTLSGELAEGQRKLLAFVAAGANPKSMNPMAGQQSNGPLAGVHEMVEAPLDPTKELTRLIPEKNHSKAFGLYKIAAEKGYVKSIHKLGICYQYGIGIEKNEIKAFESYKKAAENDHVKSIYKLGCCYQHGIGIEKNEPKAFKLYKEAAEKSCVKSIHQLGICYQHGIGIEKDESRAFELYKEAAEKGALDSIHDLGYCYQHEIGIERNHVKAFELYKEAAEKGYVKSIHQLGYCYQYGIGTEKNEIKAFELYKEASEKGDVDSMYVLGNCYFYGMGIEKDQKKAFELYKKASKNGDVASIYKLVNCYYYGVGTERDRNKAFELYKEVVEREHGRYLKYGAGTEKGESKAIELLCKEGVCSIC